MSSFKLIGVRRLWPFAELSSTGVNFNLKSVLLPLSSLCFANMSRNSTSNSSMAFRASMSNVESVQSNLVKNRLRDSWLSCGSSCSSFCKAINSWSIRFCVDVCWVSSRGSWGVGDQNVLLASTDLQNFNIVFTFWMAGSWLACKRWLNGAGLTGLTCLMFFTCFGVNIENVAMRYPFLKVDECSRKLLMSTVNCLFWTVANGGQMMKSSLSSRSNEGCKVPVTSFSVYTCDLM